jgi:hypothetical protein
LAAPLKPASAAPKPAVAAPAAIKPATAAPAPLHDAKKGTSKVEVTPPVRPAPQATVKIASASASTAATPTPAIKTAEAAAPVTSEASSDSLTGILAIAATVVALAALGIQVWMFL